MGQKANQQHRRKLLAIVKDQKGLCTYCLTPFSEENPPTRDHVLPKSKGGEKGYDNIVASCRRCNLLKGGQFWKPKIGRLS